MEQGPFREASCLFSRILWNSNFQYRVRKSLSLDPILSQLYPVHGRSPSAQSWMSAIPFCIFAGTLHMWRPYMYAIWQVKLESGRQNLFSLVTRFCTNPQFVLHIQKFTATCFIQGVISYLNKTAPSWRSTEFLLGFLKFIVYWIICLAAAIVCLPTLGVRRSLGGRQLERFAGA